MKVRSKVAGAVVALSVALGGVALAPADVGAAPAAPAVTKGSICRKADVGRTGKASSGQTVQCQKLKGQYRWVVIK